MLNCDALEVLTTKHFEAWSAFSTVIIRSYMKVFKNLKTIHCQSSLCKLSNSKFKIVSFTLRPLVCFLHQGAGESTLGLFEHDVVPFRKPQDEDEVFIKREGMEDAGDDEKEAASTIQKHFRGHHVRKRTKVMKKGTPVNLSTKQLLGESWAKIEGNELQHGQKVQNRIFVS